MRICPPPRAFAPSCHRTMGLQYGRDFEQIDVKMKDKAKKTSQERYVKTKEQIRQYYYTRVKKIKEMLADNPSDAEKKT